MFQSLRNMKLCSICVSLPTSSLMLCGLLYCYWSDDKGGEGDGFITGVGVCFSHFLSVVGWIYGCGATKRSTRKGVASFTVRWTEQAGQEEDAEDLTPLGREMTDTSQN